MLICETPEGNLVLMLVFKVTASDPPNDASLLYTCLQYLSTLFTFLSF